MKVDFLQPAQFEFDEAVEYYELQQTGLGNQFRQEIIRSIHRMTEHPTSYSPLSTRTRRCLVAKFPYGIIYQHDAAKGEILFVAIAHLHRRPSYWQSR